MKIIEGFENYSITDDGRVWSNNKKKFLKNNLIKKTGYQDIQLSKNGKIYHFLIHRLVAKAFLPNPDNLPEVNHKDECKTNNRVENLEWCDRSYNINYGTRNKKVSKVVYQYTLDNELVNTYPSTIEVVRKNNGYNLGCISLCCNGKLNKHKGFKWSYKMIDKNDNT